MMASGGAVISNCDSVNIRLVIIDRADFTFLGGGIVGLWLFRHAGFHAMAVLGAVLILLALTSMAMTLMRVRRVVPKRGIIAAGRTAK